MQRKKKMKEKPFGHVGTNANTQESSGSNNDEKKKKKKCIRQMGNYPITKLDLVKLIITLKLYPRNSIAPKERVYNGKWKPKTSCVK